MLPNLAFQSRHRHLNEQGVPGCIEFEWLGTPRRHDIVRVTQNAVVFGVADQENLAQLAVGTRLEQAALMLGDELFCRLDLVVHGQQPVSHRDRVAEITAVVPGQHNDENLWRLLHHLHSRESQLGRPLYDALTLPKLPGRGLYTEEARQERLAFLRAQTGAQLRQVERNSFDPNKLMSNIEAFIGSVEVPVGIAGPLLVKGQNVDELIYAPMATSEGALVASATRGATAISRGGGVNTRVLGQRMLRVPVFVLASMQDALFFAEWVECHFYEIKAQTKRFSNYAELKRVEPQVFGKAVHVHFIYETGDAAGQNMTTTCTWHACLWILEQVRQFNGLRFENFLIEANLSNDKKVTYQSFLKGRGIKVMAECMLPAEVTRQILKVTPQQLVQAYQMFVTGSVAAGMVGININIANVIAAIFTATGQDIACVHESAIGQLHLELAEDGEAVYASMVLPSLVVGTVGGGTSLAQQKECLELLGCAGPGKAQRLAEIICAFCLALDLSTLSAIASGQFASAHEKLGRNRPVNTLKQADLDIAFFEPMLRQSLGDESLKLLAAQPLEIKPSGSSIITELTSHKVNKLVGHFPYLLRYQDGLGHERELRVMVKSKPLDSEVILMLNSMAAMCDARLAQEYSRFKDQVGFRGCHTRELAVMTCPDERFTRHAPKVYGVYENPEREAYVIVEEFLEGLEVMDRADDLEGWTPEHIRTAIRDIAQVHAIWYGREDLLAAQPFIQDAPTLANRLEKQRLWEMLGVHAREEFPEWFSDEDLERYQLLVRMMPLWWARLEQHPKTLIHNDFNARNIAFRRTGEGLRLCAWDWELATMHLPQYDLAELLAFTLDGDITMAQIDEYVELHRQALAEACGQEIDPRQWREGFTLCLHDLVIGRMALYTMAHTFRHYKFMERVHRTMRKMIELERPRFYQVLGAMQLTGKRS